MYLEANIALKLPFYETSQALQFPSLLHRREEHSFSFFFALQAENKFCTTIKKNLKSMMGFVAT